MRVGHRAKCKKCGNECTVSEKGGLGFHLLRCDRCGQEKHFCIADAIEPYRRYLKGLGVPYSVLDLKRREFVQKEYPHDPLSEEEYHKIVEEKAGECDCGGSFRFDAPPRCPKCGSPDLLRDENGPGICCD